jgi:hypothetical protein
MYHTQTDAMSTDSDGLHINTSNTSTSASDTPVKRSSMLKSPLSKIKTPIRNLSITGMSGLLTSTSKSPHSSSVKSKHLSGGTLNMDAVHVTPSVTKALRTLLQQLQYCAALITAGHMESTTADTIDTMPINKHSKQESFDYTAATTITPNKTANRSSTIGVDDEQLHDHDNYESGRYTVASVLCKLIANEFIEGELQSHILSTSENHAQAAQVCLYFKLHVYYKLMYFTCMCILYCLEYIN